MSGRCTRSRVPFHSLPSHAMPCHATTNQENSFTQTHPENVIKISWGKKKNPSEATVLKQLSDIHPLWLDFPVGKSIIELFIKKSFWDDLADFLRVRGAWNFSLLGWSAVGSCLKKKKLRGIWFVFTYLRDLTCFLTILGQQISRQESLDIDFGGQSITFLLSTEEEEEESCTKSCFFPLKCSCLSKRNFSNSFEENFDKINYSCIRHFEKIQKFD